MIRSFYDRETERVWNGDRSRRLLPDIQDRALTRLKLLDAAQSLDDLGAVPANRLHPLRDDRAGQHSVSINAQWRICFVWLDGGAERVEIADYQ